MATRPQSVSAPWWFYRVVPQALPPARPNDRTARPRLLPVALLVISFGLGTLALLAEAQAAIVDNGVIQMGIQARGQLTIDTGSWSSNCSTPRVSIRQMAGNLEGMDCDQEGEGWGMAYDIGLPTETSCWASSGSASGSAVSWPPPLVTSFTSTASTATSVVRCGSVEITQSYNPHPTETTMYRDNITIVNVGSTDLTGLTYRRVMSWGSFTMHSDFTLEDISTLPAGSLAPPVVKATGLVQLSTNLDPTVAPSYLVQGPPLAPAVYHFPEDEAMVWEFEFGDFVPGAVQPFTLYYGVADSTVNAMSTLTAIGAQMYNLAYPVTTSAPDPDTGLGEGPIGIMAFGNLPMAPPLPPEPTPPVASFTKDTEPTCGVHAILFTDTSTPGTWEGEPSPIISWYWEFGDGTSTSTDTHPSHTYAAEGSYVVTLIVTDAHGQTSTYTMKIKVSFADCPPPITIAEDDPPVPATPRDGVDVDLAGGDVDGDGVANTLDNCATTANPAQGDLDGDAQGDLCDIDVDADGLINASDDCPEVANNDQVDLDGDALGDACDDDADGDTVIDASDNCLGLANTDQADADADGQGDACSQQVVAAAAPASRPAALDASSHASQVATKSGAPGPIAVGAAIAALAVAGIILVAVRRRQRNA